MRTFISCALAAVIGYAAVYIGTDKFHAFTSEQARQYAALNNPIRVKPAVLTTHLGQDAEFFADHERYVIVEFIFTQCPTLCQSLGRSFSQIQDRLDAETGLERVRLLSISFDLEKDGTAQLAGFADRHGADAKRWLVVRPKNQKQLSGLLKRFGIVVLEDPLYRFVHNGGLHIVSPDGELVAIFAPNDVEGALEFLEARV